MDSKLISTANGALASPPSWMSSLRGMPGYASGSPHPESSQLARGANPGAISGWSWLEI